ncbi:MAG: hypothetical protein ACRBBP_03060 [Bdellovibrionales bacterium]
MRNLILLLVVTLVTTQAFAAGDGIPMAFIKLQLMNFAFFVAMIVFLSRSKLSPLFKQFKTDYIAKSQEAQKKLDDAKTERDELVKTIEKLETEFAETLAKANEQAEVRYKAKLASVKESIQTMGKDLEGQIEGLKRSQAAELKSLLMETSIEELKKDFSSEVDEQLLIQLQNSFVEGVRI